MMKHLPYEAGIPTRQISAENPTGEKSGACHWVPDPGDPQLPHCKASLKLGKGWKVRPRKEFFSLVGGLDPGVSVALSTTQESSGKAARRRAIAVTSLLGTQPIR